MDTLVYQLLHDQASILQRLGGAHPETEEFIRWSIVHAFEAIHAQHSTLAEKDWKELSNILTDLAEIMPDDEFAYSRFAFPGGRMEVNLQPFLQEIRARTREDVT